MENKKGNGIFLGIVSVATLIVAIIGATFAYFSASTISNNGAISATAYEYNLTLSVSPIYPEGASALIPMNASAIVKDSKGEEYDANDDGVTETNLLYALNYAKDKCIDDHGLQVCALYQVTIRNEAVNPITLKGKLYTNMNEAAKDKDGNVKEGRTPFQNLTYQAIEGNHTENNFETVGLAQKLDHTVNGEGIQIADIEIPGGTKSGDSITPGVGTSYVLIYLNEAGSGQSSEMGATFEGRIEYSSGDDDTNGLTGSFTVAAPEEDPEEEQG